MQHRFYPSLDGLRCIAVAVVLTAHAGAPFPRSGGVGVDIFFVLSGFLITSILLGERDRFGSINLVNFYSRRFLRLMPCLWLTVAYAVTYGWFVDDPPWRDSILSLTYTMNWARSVGWGGDSSLAHTWSLAIEEQFYLLWPLLIVLLCRFVTSPRVRCAVLLVAAAAVASYRFQMVGTYRAERIYFGLDTHCDGLVLGAALTCFIAARNGQPLRPWWSRLTGHLLAPGAIVGLCGIMLVLTWAHPMMGRVGFVLAALGSSAIILDLVAGSHSLLRPILSQRPVLWMGKVSYGLYLWHFPIYQTVGDILGPSLSWKLRLLIGGSATIAVAAISYYGIEVRFLNMKGRFVRSTIADRGTCAKVACLAKSGPADS